MLSSIPNTPTLLKLSDKLSLRYQKTGDGPPLVLLHTIRTQLDISVIWRRCSPTTSPSTPSTCPVTGVLPSITRRPMTSRISVKASFSSSSGSICAM